MAIPDVARGALLSALSQFDAQYRGSKEWASWESNRAHRFAIAHDGKRYPVKMIVSIATGVPRNSFSGGMGSGQAGWYAEKRKLTVVSIRQK